MEKRPTLHIVDGSYYVFRAYYALRNLSNSKGFPTNALYGFVGMLTKLLNDEEVHRLVVAFDPKGGSFRNEIYPLYKANRDKPPEDLVPQFPYFPRIVAGYNIPVLQEPGFEADDVIGTLARKAVEQGYNAVLVSGDKDLTQLVGEHVWMIDTMRDRLIGPAEVRERWQIAPRQVPDLLGLWGDASDNIPGVPGVGEKTASRLISEFGSIEAVLENLHKVPGKKVVESLKTHKEQAFLSRDLATIRTDVSLRFELKETVIGRPDFAQLKSLFTELEFNRYLHELEQRTGDLFEAADAAEAARAASRSGEKAPVPAAVPTVTQDHAGKDYRVITSQRELDQVLQAIARAGEVSLDTETTSTEPMRARLVGISLSYQPHHAVYIPLAHRDLAHGDQQLDMRQVLERLRPMVEDESIAKIGQHTKYDWLVLAQHGLQMNGIRFDTMLASYILNPSRLSHSLDSLAWDHLHYQTIKFEEIAGRGSSQLTFDQVPIEVAARYSAEDAEVTLLLERVLAPLLDREGLRSLHDDLELPLSGVLARMEQRGVLVDRERLRSLSQVLERGLVEQELKISGAVGFSFNVNSPKQLREVLFDHLKLPVIKKTKTGPSTDQDVLERLQDKHPIPAMILAYRSLAKLKNTYTDTLPELIHPVTGRIHTDYRQTVAATGRLASNNPNLQNIPVRTPEGRQIREAFVAEPGKLLLSADYSQVELRIVAHLSADPLLQDAFRRGRDIHTRTASELFDLPEDQVTSEQRGIAKTINFGVLYGMGSTRLGHELHIPRQQAQEFIDRYFQRIPNLRTYLRTLVDRARQEGYARTMLGRRRPLPELESQNQGVRAQGERLAINTPIQGTAADLIKLAMVNIQRRLDREGLQAAMILQVHDELVFEVDTREVDELSRLVRQEMEGALSLDVPLSVELGSGPNWAQLKP
ncbi:MAG: DNA polymerase I [Bradymonadales bacterium]|nr:DNA polymerase I [Bradymonadales bacterium]